MLKGAWTKHAKSAKMTEDALRFSKMFVRAPCRTSDKREVPVENRLHGTHVCKCVCVCVRVRVRVCVCARVFTCVIYTYIILHYITLHYMRHYITLDYITLPCITLRICIALRCITLLI